jgi:hypothetical protein
MWIALAWKNSRTDPYSPAMVYSLDNLSLYLLHAQGQEQMIRVTQLLFLLLENSLDVKRRGIGPAGQF